MLHVLTDTAHPVGDRMGISFPLVSLIEKGKQRNHKSAKGYQKCQYPYDNHNGLICCHQHHLLPYVLLVNQGRSGGMPLLS